MEWAITGDASFSPIVNEKTGVLQSAAASEDFLENLLIGINKSGNFLSTTLTNLAASVKEVMELMGCRQKG